MTESVCVYDVELAEDEYPFPLGAETMLLEPNELGPFPKPVVEELNEL